MKQAIFSMLDLPKQALKSLLALNDSPRAIAMGIAVGMFVGLTPTVGIQTLIVVSLAALTRRFWYFNVAAACATTYVSNPVTMVPMYYAWFRLGASFVPGYEADVDFDPLVNAETWSAWWAATVEIGTSIGVPMLIGSLITAIPGSIVTYFFAKQMIKKFRKRQIQSNESQALPVSTEAASSPARVDESHNEAAVESSTSAKATTAKAQQAVTT